MQARGLGKGCYYCTKEAVAMRLDTPRCEEHMPPKETTVAKTEDDDGPATPRSNEPSLFGQMPKNWFGTTRDDFDIT